MFKIVPRVGTRFLKIIESEQIVEWKAFSEKTQEYDVESFDGKRFTIHGSKISKEVTPEEEGKFLSKRPHTD